MPKPMLYILIAGALILCAAAVMALWLARDTNKNINNYYFPKPEQIQDMATSSSLKTAIGQDDSALVAKLLTDGMSPNVRVDASLNPPAVEYAVAQQAKNVLKVLLEAGADANLRDRGAMEDANAHLDGSCSDNALTLAVELYAKDPAYLDLLFMHGGDPNTLMCNRDPIIMRFVNDHNLDGIRYMKARGADLDAPTRTGRPVIIQASLGYNWDVVWTLLDLGARYDYGEPNELASMFELKGITTRQSPQWPYKEKVWIFLHDHGVALPPLAE